MIEKQQAKRELTHPVCLHAVEKLQKVESINTKNNYEKTSNWTDKKKTNFKFQENKFEIVHRNF